MNDTQQIITTTSALTMMIITIVLTGVYAVWQWLNKTKAQIQDELPDDPTEKVDTLSKKVDDLQTLVNALYERVTSVQGVNVELSKALADVRGQLVVAEKQIGDFKELIATLQAQKDALTRERDTALENEKAGLIVIGRQNEIIEKANDEIAKLQKRIHELEIEKTAAENKLQGMQMLAGAFRAELVIEEKVEEIAKVGIEAT